MYDGDCRLSWVLRDLSREQSTGLSLAGGHPTTDFKTESARSGRIVNGR